MNTIERRRGKQIRAKGIYRDPVRSCPSHFVKAGGLRWVSLMLPAPAPWAARTGALPVLTCLAPSERYRLKHRKRDKPVLDGARQMILSDPAPAAEPRSGGVVAESACSALEWLQALARRGMTVRHPLASGCRSLRTGSLPRTRYKGPPTQTRQAATHPTATSESADHFSATLARTRLVRRSRSFDRDVCSHGG